MQFHRKYSFLAIALFMLLCVPPDANSQDYGDYGIKPKFRWCPILLVRYCEVTYIKGTTLAVGLEGEDIVNELKKLAPSLIFFEAEDKSHVYKPHQLTEEMSLKVFSSFGFLYQKGWRSGALNFSLENGQIVAINWESSVIDF